VCVIIVLANILSLFLNRALKCLDPCVCVMSVHVIYGSSFGHCCLNNVYKYM